METTETPVESPVEAPASAPTSVSAHIHKQFQSAAIKKPQSGEVVAFCAHVKAEGKVSWFECTDTTFKNSEGEGKVHWMILCAACEKHVETTGMSPAIAGIGTFNAKAPAPAAEATVEVAPSTT